MAFGLRMSGARMWVVCLALWPGVSWSADGLPEDSNEIESLTVEQARTLVRRFDGHDLELHGLLALTPDVAAVLAGFKGLSLHLDALTELSPETARAVARFKGPFPDICLLSLNGLTTLSPSVARALAEFKGLSLELGGVTAVSPETATALAELTCRCLHLGGLTTLDVETATTLAGFKGQELDLHGVTKLDAATAGALAGFKGHTLYLNGLVLLPGDAARALARFGGGGLHLDDLLATLGTTQALTPEMARLVCLAAKSPDSSVSLAGITALDGRVAGDFTTIISMVEGPLSLPNLKRISPRLLAALNRNEHVRVPPIQTLEMLPDSDESPSAGPVIPEGSREPRRRRPAD